MRTTARTIRPARLKTPNVLLACTVCLMLDACASLTSQRAEDLPYRTGTIERSADGTVSKARLAETHQLSRVGGRQAARTICDASVFVNGRESRGSEHVPGCRLYPRCVVANSPKS